MDIIVLYIIVEAMALALGGRACRDNPIARFTNWAAVTGTMAVITILSTTAWLLTEQTPSTHLWALLALGAVNAILCYVWYRAEKRIKRHSTPRPLVRATPVI